jgi:hypothetical protein
MKVSSILVFFLFNIGLGFSQLPNVDWVKTYNNNVPADIRELSIDKSGYILLTGHFGDSLNFQTGVNSESIYSNGGSDIFIQKLDNQGNIIWTKSIGGTDEDIAYGIDSDEFGNIYVTGRFSGTVNFDSGVTNFSLTATGTIDGFILKMNENGNFIWVKRIGGQFNTIPANIVYKNSNLFITGGFEGVVDFDPSNNIINKTSNGTKDFFLLKMDQNGAFNWVRTFGGNVGETGFSSVVDNSGYIYSTGYYFSQNVNYQISGQNYNLQHNGAYDIFVTKTDINGQTIWMKGFGGSGGDIGYDIALDANGDLFITGQIEDTCNIGGNALIGMGVDIMISKLDTTGNVIWANHHGGSNTDIGYSLCLDNQNHLFISGYFQDSVTTVFPTLQSNGLQDYLILQLNHTNGNIVWSKTFGGINPDLSHSVNCDDLNNLYSAGFFQNNFNLEVNSVVQNFVSSGSADGVLLKISGFSETNNIDDIDNEIFVYPNPSYDQIKVYIGENNYNYQLINSQGQVIKLGQIQNYDFISLTEFNPGIYYLHINERKPIVIIKQ